MIPPFRALFTIDAEGYSKNPDVVLPELHTTIRIAVEQACKRSGLGGTWQDVCFQQSTGDGVLAVLPYASASLLIYPFTDNLQQVLADIAPQLRSRRLRLRLRAAVHVGLVDDEDPVTGGISAATNDVSRLLDCEPLRGALRDSDPDITFAAMIVSAQAYDLFVRGGHTNLEPSQFKRVRAKVKQFEQVAYLYVPTPSCRNFDTGEENQAVKSPEESEHDSSSGVPSFRVSIKGSNSQNVIGNRVGGNITQKRS